MRQSHQSELSPATIQWLLAHNYSGENLNQQGENGDTALIKATRLGVVSVVQELIDAGADLNGRNYDRNNALWFACLTNHYDLMRLLLDAHIDIDNQNDNGATVLMYGASAGKTKVVQLLLEYNPNMNLSNLDDYKAIDFASNIEVLRLLKNATK